MPDTTNALITRARTAIGKVRYGLGCGGLHGDDPLPARPILHTPRHAPAPVLANWCDCSGFVAWVLGRSRKPAKDFPLWLCTDSVANDAKGKQRLFERIDAPVPGCIAVYGDWKDGKGQPHQGHIALVVDPAKHVVIDCSSDLDGVAEHVQEVFWNGKHNVIWCVAVALGC